MVYSDDGDRRVGSELSRSDAQFSLSPTGKAELEQLAAQLHMANRRRRELFNHEIMADRVMDIMLTVLIAQEQGTVLGRSAVAMANRLHPSEADRIIDALVQAHFLRHGTQGDSVRLTVRGHELMQDYVRGALGMKNVN